MADNMTAGKKLIDPTPIISKLADRALHAKGAECSVLGEVIDMLMAAPLILHVEQRWIPVTEELPDNQHDWVLVACKLTPEGWYGVPHIAELRKGVWWADCYDTPLTDAGVEVTHWMPLPSGPEEVK